MPSQTNYLSKEHNITNAPGNYGTAKDDHAPIGWVSSSGWRYRDLMKFSSSGPPAGAKIVSCVLRVKTTGGNHTQQGGSPRINIRRCTESWAGTGGGTEQWRSDADPVGFSISSTATGMRDASFGGADNTVYDFDITSIYEAFCSESLFKRDGTPAGGSTNYGILIMANDESDTNDRCEFWSMRGSYQPRVIITWTVPVAATEPELVAPLGQVATQPTQFSFKFPSGDGAEQYEIEVGTALDTNNLWNPALATATPGTQQNVAYAGTALPTDGSTVFWRVRGRNEVGTYGPWAHGTFNLAVGPVVTLVTDVMAEVHNLDDLNVWTGSNGRARLKATYSHPQGQAPTAWEVEVGGVVVPATVALVGSQYQLDIEQDWARNTNMSVRIRAQGGGQWSPWTAAKNIRIQWAQGVYTFTFTAGSSGFVTKHGTLVGDPTKVKVVYLYRNTAGPGAWSTSIVSAAVGTSVDMLIRLSSFDPAINPALPSARIEWQEPGTGGLFDFWHIPGTSHSLAIDSDVRRFGQHSAKIIPGAVASHFRTSRVVPVAGGTKYTLSAYVNTGGLAAKQYFRPMLLTETGALVAMAPAPPAPAAGTPTPPSSTYGLHPNDNTVIDQDGWRRIYWQVTTPGGLGSSVNVIYGFWLSGAADANPIWVDAVQFEEGSVATGWKPGMAGPAVVMDVGGIVIDGRAGGILRLVGSGAGSNPGRDIVTLGPQGLVLGGDLDLTSPSPGVLALDGTAVSMVGHTHGASGGTAPVVRAYTANATWTKPAGIKALHYRLIGGGGAGGGTAGTASGTKAASAGGGSGACIEGWFYGADLTALTSLAFVLGTGGVGVTGNTVGGDGVASTLTSSPAGFTATAGGGKGGQGSAAVASTVAALPAGGDGGNSALNTVPVTPIVIGAPYAGTTHAHYPGNIGEAGLCLSGEVPRFGSGAPSILGGSCGAVVNADGATGAAPGAGGSGQVIGAGQATARKGGNGANGILLIEEYY